MTSCFVKKINHGHQLIERFGPYSLRCSCIGRNCQFRVSRNHCLVLVHDNKLFWVECVTPVSKRVKKPARFSDGSTSCISLKFKYEAIGGFATGVSTRYVELHYRCHYTKLNPIDDHINISPKMLQKRNFKPLGHYTCIQCGTPHLQTVQENILSHIILATYRKFTTATVRFTQTVSCIHPIY